MAVCFFFFSYVAILFLPLTLIYERFGSWSMYPISNLAISLLYPTESKEFIIKQQKMQCSSTTQRNFYLKVLQKTFPYICSAHILSWIMQVLFKLDYYWISVCAWYLMEVIICGCCGIDDQSSYMYLSCINFTPRRHLNLYQAQMRAAFEVSIFFILFWTFNTNVNLHFWLS